MPSTPVSAGKYIARSLHLLASSSAEQRNEVRVLVYGQSISKQDWWWMLRNRLQARYPHARLVMHSRAIGGFDSSRLVHCAEADVLLFAPDLVLFQDYGPEDCYEEIIRAIRARTAAEIAVQNDHISIGQDAAWHDRHSFEWLPRLCETYQMEFIDVRSRWTAALRQNGLDPQALLEDSIHLNPAGNRLMAEIVQDALALSETWGADPQSLVTRLRPTPSANALEIEFAGARLDLTLNGRGRMRVLLDGEPPSRHPDVYLPESPWIEQPDDRPERVGMPVRVELGQARQAEHWYIKVDEVQDDGREVGFSLFSQSGGFEGEGSSAADFTARSGRVRLLKAHWFVREHPEFFQGLKAVRTVDSIRFEVKRLALDWLDVAHAGKVTLLNGLRAGKHTLTLINEEQGQIPVDEVLIYHPPLG